MGFQYLNAEQLGLWGTLLSTLSLLAATKAEDADIEILAQRIRKILWQLKVAVCGWIDLPEFEVGTVIHRSTPLGLLCSQPI